MHNRIQNRNDYKEFLEADKLSNHIKRKYPIPFFDYMWIYLRIMRSLEFLENCYPANKKILKAIQKFRLRQYSVKLGVSIPPNTFGKGLTLWHWGSIVVNPTVDGGDYVVIQSDVNISADVVIGNNVYLAPGVKVLEHVQIADNVIVGANSVVTKSISECNTTWVGAPSSKIKDVGYTL